MTRPIRLGAVVVVFLAACAGEGLALDEANVLVVYNQDHAGSDTITSHYLSVHPGAHGYGLSLGADVPEQVQADEYLGIRQDVFDHIGRLEAAGESIDCIVTTKGLPLRVYNPQGTGLNRYSSLESELAWGDHFTTAGEMAQAFQKNPYYSKNTGFDRSAHPLRLTSRLDGFTVEDVTGAIDRAQRTAWGRPGYNVLIDDDPDPSYDRMSELCDYVLDPHNAAYVRDETDAFVTDISEPGAERRALGYVTHGTNAGPETPSGYLQEGGPLLVEAAPGAVFHSYESFNAYSFESGGNRYGQALVGEWIERGGTAAAGCVEEPGLSSEQVTNEHLLFHMLLEGYTFAEAAWDATWQISYVNTFVGDPLMTWQPWVPGDCDLDGDVDIVDITLVKSAYGTTVGDELYNVFADLNGDGDVDLGDLNDVKTGYYNYWNSDPEVAGTWAPEPTTLGLLCLGALGLLRRRRPRTTI